MCPKHIFEYRGFATPTMISSKMLHPVVGMKYLRNHCLCINPKKLLHVENSCPESSLVESAKDTWGFPGGSMGREFIRNAGDAGDTGSIRGL